MIVLNRRTFLRGLSLGAGAALLTPLMRELLADAAEATPAKRFVVITNGNGFLTSNYEREVVNETQFELGGVLTPLEPFRDDLLFLEMFYNPHDRALHGNQWATLAVMPSPNQGAEELRGPPGGISIDRLIAREIGSADAFPSIALALKERGNGNTLCVSADGANQPFPAISSPVRAFQTYFGNLVEGSGSAEQRLTQDLSLLDFMHDDVDRLNARLASPERLKLEQYMDSMRTLEIQLKELHDAAQGSCNELVGPDAALDQEFLDPAIVIAHIDIASHALQCGLTRVAHIAILGMEGPHDRYGWLGDTIGHHEQHHQSNAGMIAKIETYILEQVAAMWDRLRSVPSADGSLADSSLLMYVNTCGGIHHNGQDTHAVVLLGSAGGYFRTGRYLSYPHKQHCISDVFVSVANAMDVGITVFGTPEHCQGPLPGLT